MNEEERPEPEEHRVAELMANIGLLLTDSEQERIRRRVQGVVTLQSQMADIMYEAALRNSATAQEECNVRAALGQWQAGLIFQGIAAAGEAMTVH
jgi:hypothetical protein